MTWRVRYFAEGRNVSVGLFPQFAPALLFFSARVKFSFALNHNRNVTVLTGEKNATQAILRIAPATILLISEKKKKMA